MNLIPVTSMFKSAAFFRWLLFISCYPPVIAFFAYSPYGIPQASILWNWVPPLLFLFGCCSAFIGICILGISKFRAESLPLVVLCFATSVAVILSTYLSSGVREIGLMVAMARAKKLIEVLSLYEAEHGRAPVDLNLLVPKYFPSTPGTGLAIYPQYEYKSYPEKGVAWELSIQCPAFPYDIGEIFYRPLHNYPRERYNAEIERKGDWASVLANSANL